MATFSQAHIRWKVIQRSVLPIKKMRKTDQETVSFQYFDLFLMQSWKGRYQSTEAMLKTARARKEQIRQPLF